MERARNGNRLTEKAARVLILLARGWDLQRICRLYSVHPDYVLAVAKAGNFPFGHIGNRTDPVGLRYLGRENARNSYVVGYAHG